MSAPPKALRAIALFEALKGIAALAALVGLLDVLHHDVRQMVLALIGRYGLDPAAHYPSLLLHYAELLPHANVQQLVLLGAGYVLLRLAEAYGLWHGTSWGEWLAALSGGLYLPFEWLHLVRHPTLVAALVVGGNLLLVAYLLWRLYCKRRAGRV